jgi:hypothetical protein
VVNPRSHPQLKQVHRRNPRGLRKILAPMLHSQSTLRWTSHNARGMIRQCSSIEWSSSLTTKEPQRSNELSLLLSTLKEKQTNGGSGCNVCTRRKEWRLPGMCPIESQWPNLVPPNMKILMKRYSISNMGCCGE